MKVDVIAIKGKTYELTRNFIQKFTDDPRNISTTYYGSILCTKYYIPSN
jgi:hypothetical protein